MYPYEVGDKVRIISLGGIKYSNSYFNDEVKLGDEAVITHFGSDDSCIIEMKSNSLSQYALMEFIEKVVDCKVTLDDSLFEI